MLADRWFRLRNAAKFPELRDRSSYPWSGLPCLVPSAPRCNGGPLALPAAAMCGRLPAVAHPLRRGPASSPCLLRGAPAAAARDRQVLEPEVGQQDAGAALAAGHTVDDDAAAALDGAEALLEDVAADPAHPTV